jgi:hypothetical protein
VRAIARPPAFILQPFLQPFQSHEHEYRTMNRTNNAYRTSNHFCTNNDYRIFPLLPGDLQGCYASPPGCRQAAAARPIPVTFMLNPRDWFDVLYFVNRFAIEYGGGDRGFALKAERLIHQQLPLKVRVRRQVEDWLLQHWRLD